MRIDDPCCILCSHVTGICRSRYACQHHKDAQKQDDANHRARLTVRDPTGNAAVGNIMRERRKERRI